MQPSLRWSVPTFLLFLAACGTRGDAATALNPPVIDTLPGHIVHVRNTGPTAWTDTSGWRLVPVTTINPPDGSPGELGALSGIALADDGTVYAFQQKPVTIKVFGPDGKYLRDIGREGDGPGEIRSGMLSVQHDTLVVQDPNGKRLTFFKGDGSFIRTVQSTCCYWTRSLTIDSLGRIWSPGSVGKEGNGGWVRFGMDGVAHDTILMPPTGEDRSNAKYWTVTMKSGGNSSSMMMSIPLQPATWQFLRDDGAVLIGNTAKLSFAVLANGKDSSRVFESEAPRLPLTEATRDSAFEKAISHQSEQWRDALRKSAKKDDLPQLWPAWTNAVSDRHGRLWVSLPGPRGEVSRLTVFGTDGRMLGDVPLPSTRMFTNLTWSQNGMAFMDEDDDGRAVIRVFRLDTAPRK